VEIGGHAFFEHQEEERAVRMPLSACAQHRPLSSCQLRHRHWYAADLNILIEGRMKFQLK